MNIKFNFNNNQIVNNINKNLNNEENYIKNNLDEIIIIKSKSYEKYLTRK